MATMRTIPEISSYRAAWEEGKLPPGEEQKFSSTTGVIDCRRWMDDWIFFDHSVDVLVVINNRFFFSNLLNSLFLRNFNIKAFSFNFFRSWLRYRVFARILLSLDFIDQIFI